MRKKLNCVVIPVYKPFEHLTENEKLSIRQCFTVLHKHPVFFAGPESLDYNGYLEESRSFGIAASLKKFDNLFFKSIDGYNKLMLSRYFYRAFAAYRFLLIYQPDAFVFRDELDYWCSLNYDYIGAPWFKGHDQATAESPCIGVGNGGFSLRNIPHHLKVLNSFSYITPLKSAWKEFSTNISLRAFIRFIKNITIQNNTFFLFNNFKLNEDLFWGSIVTANFSWFRTPDMNVALKFSMEVNAPLLYRINDKKLPFGCHAWEKHEREFWEPFITADKGSKGLSLKK